MAEHPHQGDLEALKRVADQADARLWSEGHGTVDELLVLWGQLPAILAELEQGRRAAAQLELAEAQRNHWHHEYDLLVAEIRPWVRTVRDGDQAGRLYLNGPILRPEQSKYLRAVLAEEQPRPEEDR